VQIDEVLGLKNFTAVRPETVELNTGLKMSRVLIEAHQGQMRMRAKGDGMTTTLVLPRERIARAQAASPKPLLTSSLRRTA
jgi:light-regulated signal transduction histidine kinase (bacteriophytochrome)